MMNALRHILVVLFLALPVMAADLVVKIGDAESVFLTDKDLELLPHQTVKAKEHGGEEAEWSGVPLYQVLQRAGFSFGDSLRGRVLSQYVLITAADDYKVVIALPELDPRCSNDPVILATEKDGAAIPAEQGPWRLVLPAERKHFRWVRQVVKIEVKEGR